MAYFFWMKCDLVRGSNPHGKNWLLVVTIECHCQWHWSGCRKGYEVTKSWYAVVMMSFYIAFSCLKVGICSCTVRYTVTQLSIIWVRSLMVISQFSTVHMVKSVQLHLFLCNCVSWSDNLIPVGIELK